MSESDSLARYVAALQEGLVRGKTVYVSHFNKGNVVPIDGTFDLPRSFSVVLKTKIEKTGEWICEVQDKGECKIHPCYFERNHLKVQAYFDECHAEWEQERLAKQQCQKNPKESK